ncbi:hypothetical protein CG419_03985 [Latilactobacillus curvatus]|uniref:DUF3383 family protein n=1 Tax=Latilactobacillus curvatus TaxID=28038 RepID=A0AAC9Y0E8_LATCU|nr:DUF3383 family protein [Latilactobacillus curvatus]ASN59835.1 hypothetical protein CG419_03985 [Latilactobacillus curvatus]
MTNTTLSDVEVVLNVQQPTVPINMGTLAVFQPASANGMKTYSALEDLADDVTDSEVQSLARGYFAQTGHSKQLVIISYVDMATALKAYFNTDWEFATIAGAAPVVTPPEGGGTRTANANDAMTLSNYIEEQMSRFYVVGLPATEETVNNTEKIKQEYFGNKRTILFAAGVDELTAQYAVGALIGSLGNKQVGSITWKFKTLSGVDPADYNAAQVAKLHDNGIFTYVNKAGIAQTSEGFTVTGEFIDALHGDDWVRASMETALQKMLSTTDKLSYDAAGISQIEAVATAVMLQATANGIVLVNDETNAGKFAVSAQSRAQSTADNIAKRHYDGLSFTYTRSGAIHSITVHGTVEL